jgi:oligosaccharide reducing-end xylanase
MAKSISPWLSTLLRTAGGEGIYNYQSEADKILCGMRHHPVLSGTGPFRIHPDDPPFTFPDHPWPSPNNTDLERAAAASSSAGAARPPMFGFNRGSQTESIGPMVDESHFMIRFVPNVEGGNTDASYYLPAFYELWARWGPVEDRAFWAKAADVSRDLFSKVTGLETGLTPDRSNFDETPIMGWDGLLTPFSYDSWRSASNWSVDYDWWQKDPRETVSSDRIQRFLLSQDIDKFVDRYTLDGKPLSTRHSIGMLATTAVASFAATPGSTSKAFVEALWNTPVPSGEQRYYDGMLYLMSMLHCSGNFRIIKANGSK